MNNLCITLRSDCSLSIYSVFFFANLPEKKTTKFINLLKGYKKYKFVYNKSDSSKQIWQTEI